MPTTGIDVQREPTNHLGCYSDTFWSRTFARARRSGEWVLVERRYSKATALQLVCDIKNAHRRPFGVVRVRGILPGEVWLARRVPVERPLHGDHEVWVRLLVPAPNREDHAFG